MSVLDTSKTVTVVVCKSLSKSGTNYPQYMPQSYSSGFGMTDDQHIHDQDHVQDLDSWQSSEDSLKESRMKQSKAMLDLSKFNLEDSDDQDAQVDQGQVPEKIYDR